MFCSNGSDFEPIELESSGSGPSGMGNNAPGFTKTNFQAGLVGDVEEVIMELQKYGAIEEMNVYDNLGDHLMDNVYVNVPAFPPLETRGGGISVPKGHHLSLNLRSITKSSPAPELLTNPLKVSEFDYQT